MPASAQGSPIHGYIGEVADAFYGTPTGQGLLPTAVAEAEIAAVHAAFALIDPTNLDGIKLHVGHVLHAIEPGLAPGQVYEQTVTGIPSSTGIRWYCHSPVTIANNIIQPVQ